MLSLPNQQTDQLPKLIELVNSRYRVPKNVLANFTPDVLAGMYNDLCVNPWLYCDPDLDFTVGIADRVGKNQGIDFSNPTRKEKIFNECLYNSTKDGHTILVKGALLHTLMDKYDLTFEEATALFNTKLKDKVIAVQNELVYVRDYVNIERNLAQLLLDFSQNNEIHTFSTLDKTLTDKQLDIFNTMRLSNLGVLTGLPGTGKTYTLNALVKSALEIYPPEYIFLVAPTGKAARRMTQMSNFPAKTIHSIAMSLRNKIDLKAEGPLENCFIIVDETSMLDLFIAYKFLRYFSPYSCKLLLVGDFNQLPAIGPGTLLKDVIDHSYQFDTVFLDEIKRQDPGSLLKTAHSIVHKSKITMDDDDQIRFITYTKDSLKDVVKTIAEDPEWKDAQFITTLKKNFDGSKNLNKLLQELKNPGEGDWRLGDPVIHLVNDSLQNLYNGEFGVINEISPNQRIFRAKFDTTQYEYSLTYNFKCDLAYAITVHKSQGSEFDKVVFVANDSYISTKNLIYTAITRTAKKLLILIKEEELLNQMLHKQERPRRTLFKRFLKEKINGD